jgi:hypothetical protein
VLEEKLNRMKSRRRNVQGKKLKDEISEKKTSHYENFTLDPKICFV